MIPNSSAKNMIDADGIQINLGSVLEKIETGEVGVVSRVVKEGDFQCTMEQVGDIFVEVIRGCYTVTSLYETWRHVPKEKQTFDQRYRSWFYSETNHDTEEDFYVYSIMKLVDDNLYDEDSYPLYFQDALKLMSTQLTKLEEKVKLLESGDGNESTQPSVDI